MTMDENQSSSFRDSKCMGKDEDSLDVGSKEIYELNDSGRDISEIKCGGDCRNHKVVDELPLNYSNRSVDSPRKEGQNGLSHHSRDQGKDSLSFDTFSKDEEERSREHECLITVGEHARYNGNESRDSASPCNDSSYLFQTETNASADKNVLDCDTPELEVCYKEIDHHVVKDICVDEGRPEKGRILRESSNDEKSGHVYSQIPNDDSDCKAKEECAAQEKPHTDKNKDSECKAKEECIAQEMPHPVKNNDLRANFGTAEKPAIYSSEEENSLVDRKLPGEEFGTQNFGKCLVVSLDVEEKVVKQQPDQIADGKAISQNSDVMSTDAGVPGEVTRCGSVISMESESFTYNFNVPVISEDVKEQPVNSEDVCEHKDRIADGLSDSKAGNVAEKPVIMAAKVVEQPNEHKGPKLDNHSADDQVESPGNTSQGSTNEDAETVEPCVPRHEPRSSNNISAMARLLHDEGETSFSAASLINYSEPVPFSGSLSHRSDGSATSARSFAFPVLPSEWNSSPVRMAKADRRHLRKHKFWRSGLFCCKF